MPVAHRKPPMQRQCAQLQREHYSWISRRLSICGSPESSTTIGNGLTHLTFLDCVAKRLTVAPARTAYIALSYVWGSQKHSIWERDLEWSSMPLTVGDAVHVVQNLGHKYLWVDRYCIDQNDQASKHHLINNMDQVFAAGKLTIVAASGNDADHGLPGVSATGWTSSPHFCSLGSYDLITTNEPPSKAIESSVWRERGWNYQEGVLSTRKLYFTAFHVYLDFGTEIHAGCYLPSIDRVLWIDLCEDTVPSSPSRFRPVQSVREVNTTDHIDNPAQYLRENLKEFYRHVCSYRSRILTYDGDFLNAISGVLNQFAVRNHPIYHCWGMPVVADESYTFAQAMYWRCYASILRRRSGLPSWSWTGWHFAEGDARSVYDFDAPEPRSAYNAVVAVISLMLEDGAILGLSHVDSQQFSLHRHVSQREHLSQVRLVEAHVATIDFRRHVDMIMSTNRTEHTAGFHGSFSPGSGSATSDAYISIWLDAEPDEALRGFVESNQLVCAFLADDGLFLKFLLLAPEDDHYVRVGIVDVDAEEEDVGSILRLERRRLQVN